MIDALRKRLTLLLIAVISAVVICTVVAVIAVSERRAEQISRARFDAQVELTARDVRMDEIIETARLAKTEAANDMIISIQDASGPIPFRGGWQPATDRSALIARAMQSASDSDEAWDGTVTGDRGERYLASVRRISRYRGEQCVVMLADMRSEDAQRMAQRLIYIAIALLALAFIAGFCRFFTGRATRPIREAYDRQNQFVLAASHELRTPMQVIGTAAEALKLGPPDRELFADQIVNELAIMGKLTESLLVLAAAPDWKTVKGGPVEVDALIRGAMDNYTAAAKQKGVVLSLEAPNVPLPLLEGDGALLERALNALIDNAVFYTPSGGRVTVSAALKPRNVEIAVQDDGAGVEAEHRPHIFERFYRADKSRADRAHSGLGLSIARQIAVSHGGRLTYANVEPHGSRFCLVLPRIGNAVSKISRSPR